MEVVPQLNLNKNLNERNPFLGKRDPAVLTPEVVETLKRRDTQLSQNSCSSLPQREETETSRLRWRQCRGRCCGAIRAWTPCVRARSPESRAGSNNCAVWASCLRGAPAADATLSARAHVSGTEPADLGHAPHFPRRWTAGLFFFFRASAPYLLKRHLTETQH